MIHTSKTNVNQGNEMSNLTSATKRAIANYGEQTCRDAYRQHANFGEGAATVGAYFNITTRQADAAINAGRELAVETAPVVIRKFPVKFFSAGNVWETQVDSINQLDAEAQVRRAGNLDIPTECPANRWPRA